MNCVALFLPPFLVKGVKGIHLSYCPSDYAAAGHDHCMRILIVRFKILQSYKADLRLCREFAGARDLVARRRSWYAWCDQLVACCESIC